MFGFHYKHHEARWQGYCSGTRSMLAYGIGSSAFEHQVLGWSKPMCCLRFLKA